jgi:hypothetical protein
MAATLMTHPQHGAMHAYDSGEIARLKGFGWSVADEPPSEPVATPGDAPETVVSLDVKRRGRPPKAK